jgi:hypothetical protein
MTKDLRKKAITIKGKEYIQVKDRLTYFNETYPNGSIETLLVSQPESNMVVVKAIVTPNVENGRRCFIGHSQARWDDKASMVNASAAMENAETSAVGRALAMMGIGIIDSVASADEMRKVETNIVPTLKEKTVKPNGDTPRCEKCGAPLAVSKSGKLYCSALCWTKQVTGTPDSF